MALPPIEIAAVVLAIAYVVLAARSSNWCWPVGFVSSALWAYQVWVAYDLLFDAALNGFYAVISVVGFLKWRRSGERPADPGPITELSLGAHAVYIACGVALTLLLAPLAERLAGAALAYPDALTTVGSVIGTVLLIQRRLSNWLYFIVMDVIYVWLYLDRGSPVFAGLFVVYVGLAAYGYMAWRREAAAQVALTA